jgi:hypothetical protein
MQFEERQLVPIAPLKRDHTLDAMEKAPSAQPFRIAPFENGLFAVLEHIFGKAALETSASNIFRIAARPSSGRSAT